MVKKVKRVVQKVLILCLGGFFVFTQVVYATDDPRLPRINRTKELYGFSKWAGNVKISGKNFTKLPITEADFSKYGEIKVYTREKDRDKDLDFRLLGDQETSGASIQIGLCESPLVAQEAIIRELAIVQLSLSYYKKAESGALMDVGDVCFFNSVPLPPGVLDVEGKTFCGLLWFSRNNACIKIRNDQQEGRKYFDTLELARFIDAKLTGF